MRGFRSDRSSATARSGLRRLGRRPRLRPLLFRALLAVPRLARLIAARVTRIREADVVKLAEHLGDARHVRDGGGRSPHRCHGVGPQLNVINLIELVGKFNLTFSLTRYPCEMSFLILASFSFCQSPSLSSLTFRSRMVFLCCFALRKRPVCAAPNIGILLKERPLRISTTMTLGSFYAMR